MIGVVVMAYGTPASPDDVEAYYTHIRRGRPPTTEQLDDLIRRYDAIGGVSPLAARTEAQRAAIAATLDHDAPTTFVTATGNKHAAPFVEDAVAGLVERGADELVGVVLAPHHSDAGVGEYHRRALTAAGTTPYHRVDRWYDLDEFVEHQAAALRDALSGVPAGAFVLFTAHSLPERVLEGDTYVAELTDGAAAIAARAGVAADRWATAWQSAGRTPEPWAGPDLLEVIPELAARGERAVVVVPHGFVADHLEVAYDLDLDAARVATGAGLAFARAAVVDDDAGVMAALARRIMAVAGPAANRAPT